MTYYTGGCIRDIGQVQSNGSWGSLYFVGISYDSNSCLHPAAQFRFLDNGAMLSLKRQGCLAAFNRNGSGFNLDMFYVYVGSEVACTENPDKGIYRALNQSKEGGLSVYYKENRGRSFQIWCALVSYNRHFENNYGIDKIVRLAQDCHSSYNYYSRIFNFGKFLHSKRIEKDRKLVSRHLRLRAVWSTDNIFKPRAELDRTRSHY